MKTYVLDASALFIFLQRKPSSEKVSELLKEAMRDRAEILMSAVNFGEVYGTIRGEYGPDRVASVMNAVQHLPIHFVDATPSRACAAADLKSQYKLYYVDSFAAALAFEYHATLVTSDADFRRLGHHFPVLWLK